MKKNNISIDFVAFGDLESDTTKKLEAFNENVTGAEGSHLAVIPPGPNLLSDSIVTTPILSGDGVGPSGPGGAGGEGAAAEGGEDFELGVDPAADPELAFALRMSLEEEKARLEKEKQDKEDAEGKASLEGIPEEGGESQPLLNQSGEPSGSGGGSNDKDKGKDNEDDGDKMDTA